MYTLHSNQGINMQVLPISLMLFHCVSVWDGKGAILHSSQRINVQVRPFSLMPSCPLSVCVRVKMLVDSTLTNALAVQR